MLRDEKAREMRAFLLDVRILADRPKGSPAAPAAQVLREAFRNPNTQNGRVPRWSEPAARCLRPGFAAYDIGM